ncbi:MAG TPA: helix-turn-helix domain-containing protein [Mycobacteriales bacterium]|jgi:DNA-binding HxlR family transcriptional regulator|nr:helix-turn-helix domain-containing protein [Mycobacteriales bacterium]
MATRSNGSNQTCSIARSVEVLGERWTFLIIREALSGVTRFADFRDRLGIAADVLTDRLTTLVESGVLEKVPYQEPGRRARHAYQLTEAGLQLRVVLGALQQWGDAYRPNPAGPTIERRTADGNSPLRVAFVDDSDRAVPLSDVAFIKTAAYPD